MVGFRGVDSVPYSTKVNPLSLASDQHFCNLIEMLEVGFDTRYDPRFPPFWLDHWGALL